MHTDEHRTAVLATIDLVNIVQPADLGRPTPCAGWDLADLLAHMTVQHRGFAAAARGRGHDLDRWQAESVADAVRHDPRRTYADAAHDVLSAFSAEGIDDALFALPEFGDNAVFPGAIAMGFHFVDYVVHGWDVAASLGVDYELPADVLSAALPLVLAVPDGDVRDLDAVPFDRAVERVDDATDLDRILRHLGRRPEFTNREVSGATYPGPNVAAAT
ncbi:TIGR03086 family metal-binding protein [Mycolicibacterium sp. P1-5]|uniref:TIGR03086 family metal-binding protein n=1 Tax=Mycolicibacterium sp. P1-5 TaxID=2024617 RepID=UPI0011EFFB2A|nr:TIGR03086 family metal-binding protein [Mycolicibacterium sp. P1-5]KAA0109784.1 TIGR03086 family protein [Mycolicibacterium sp. P1-5]